MRAVGLALVLALAFAWAGAAPAGAKVFMSKAEALAWAFPEADRVEDRSYVLDDAQAAAIEARAKAKLESRLVTVYTGRKGDAVLGYAFIDQHVVRTLPEAFLVVLSPEGEVRRLRVLAFHEPQEYKPSDRFLAQFEGKQGDAPLRLARDVHGIAGATLSSQAVTGGVRRVLALHDVLVRQPLLAQHRP
ncbi:MAG: FMN-binding protein [Proteobacteria bacterium]|nr:MAG: FMN-binding protein [Pseudomonadota bacterium]